jgi:hypothetical protein
MRSYQLPIFSVRKLELGLLVIALLWYTSIWLLLTSANDYHRISMGWQVMAAFGPLLSAALAFALDRSLKALDRPMRLREILLIVFVSP